ncbi:hypothetical protein GGF37_002086 [Kickxella alabastrina]|nr:hypothetical protein GGF37_002086 [Kickxella alabastrina]
MSRRSSNGVHQATSGHAEARETNDSDGAINGPIVFSCAKCRTILGDTFAYVASLPERNLFGLQSVPDSVVVSKVKRNTDDGIYHELNCSECQAGIGRRYVTTTEDLDSVRNTFALDIDRVLTYELGKCLKGEENVRRPTAEFYTSVGFHNDLGMVKSNVTAIAARLQKLEQALMQAKNPVNSPPVAGGSRKRASASGADIYPVDPSKRFGR